MIRSNVFQVHPGKETKQEVLTLQYSGRATTMQIDTLLDLLEKMLIHEGIATSLRRRIYSIAMEALQNLSVHVPDQFLEAAPDVNINPGFIRFLFEGEDGQYRIETCNYVLKANLDTIIEKIEKINGLNEQEQKEYYNYLIKNLPFSEKGGAGLGLLDIARKSKQPLQYAVSGTNGHYALFTLSVGLNGNIPVSVPLAVR